MKYETPELTALVPAINAIQSTGNPKTINGNGDSVPNPNEVAFAYQDWE